MVDLDLSRYHRCMQTGTACGRWTLTCQDITGACRLAQLVGGEHLFANTLLMHAASCATYVHTETADPATNAGSSSAWADEVMCIPGDNESRA